ncbi:S-adenosyl-L-methionine-dependent methyltransferase [Aspergillus desertorum]
MTNDLLKVFKNKDFAARYRLAEQLTGLYALPLIDQSGIVSYANRPIVLDNACGTGIIGSVLNHTLSDQVKKNWELTCGDFSQAMVEHTRQRAVDEGWRNTIAKIVNAQEMDLPDEYFTHVYTAFAFALIPDTPAALKECLRILKPGGIFAASVWKDVPHLSITLSSLSPLQPFLPLPNASEYIPQLLKDWDSENHVQSQLESAGFTDVKVTAVTVQTAIPIAEFVELTKSMVPAFLGKHWTREQREKHEGEIPEVMARWLEGEYGVGGLVPLQPTALVVTAKRPE